MEANFENNKYIVTSFMLRKQPLHKTILMRNSIMLELLAYVPLNYSSQDPDTQIIHTQLSVMSDDRNLVTPDLIGRYLRVMAHRQNKPLAKYKWQAVKILEVMPTDFKQSF